MKNLKLIFFGLAAALLSLSACQEMEGPVSIEFAESAYQMTVGQTMDLAGELKITNSDEKPAFTTSNVKVASVDKEGKVTAVSQGKATITATVAGSKAVCEVQVADIKAGKITVTAPASLPADESWASVTASVDTEGFLMANLEWTFTATEGLVFESEKVTSSEYKVRFKSFVQNGALSVKVSDRNSDANGTAVIAVTEKIVVATKIALDMPAELTEGEVWASVTATVTPSDYDVEDLVWEFKPSSSALGFKYEKVNAAQYNVCFTDYVPEGFVTIVVSDSRSAVFNQGRIAVLEKPVEGVKKLSVSPAELALSVGDEPFALQVTYDPSDYDKSLFEWSTSDSKVVTVADGVITVVGEGVATIKIKDTISGLEAATVVTVTTPVKEAVISRIDISQVNLHLRVGEDAVQLTAACYDQDGNLIENYAGLEWSAEPMIGENGREITVVEVSQLGVVTPRNAGSTQIVVRDSKISHVRAICNVTVSPAEIKVQEVKLEPSSKVIEIGQEFALTPVIAPANAENKTLTYTSSNESIVTVNAQGVVKGIVPGEAVVTATSVNGMKGTCKITVAEETWVFLSETELTMIVGAEKVLTATVTPENAPDKTVVWSSSDATVASVDNGKITALKEGTAVIKASAANGKSAECKVTVESSVIDFDITLTPSDPNLETAGLMQDKTVKFTATYVRKKDGQAHVPAVTSWKSSDESIATVDNEGNVTAVIPHIDYSGLSNGVKVTITHIAEEKEQSVEITVVKALPESVVLTAIPEVNGEQFKMMHGETFTFKAKVLPEKARQDVWFAGGGYMYVNDNTYTANTIGYHTFVAYASDNSSAKYEFSIVVLPVPATEMTLNNTSLEMETGAQAALVAAITPSNASYQTVEWTSSNEAVATVDSHGVITALTAGTTTITAVQKDNNLTCTCEVTVKEHATAGPAVGDFYYSDGTTSSTLDATKTVIGVVFSVANPVQMGDANLTAEYPGCVNGYVVSTQEYESPFGTFKYDDSGDANRHVYAYIVKHGTEPNESLANGYSLTKALGAYRAEYLDYNYCVMFDQTTGVAATHAASVAAPASTTSWYIPSYKEMTMLHESMETVNSSIEAAGGTKIGTGIYWSSTLTVTNKYKDCSAYPFNMATGSRSSTVSNSSKSVRVVFAF